MSENKELPGLITSLVSLIAVACFVILGFTTGAWYLFWLFFLAIPITAILTYIITNKKNIPNTIVGIVCLLALIAFY